MRRPLAENDCRRNMRKKGDAKVPGTNDYSAALTIRPHEGREK
jgi:hypothetical protein